MLKKILLTVSCVLAIWENGAMQFNTVFENSYSGLHESALSKKESEEMCLSETIAHRTWDEYKKSVFIDPTTFSRFIMDVYAGGYKEFGCLYKPLLKYRYLLASNYIETLLGNYDACAKANSLLLLRK
jgi:hypothetical protein